jgi:hypothetical protein
MTNKNLSIERIAIFLRNTNKGANECCERSTIQRQTRPKANVKVPAIMADSLGVTLRSRSAGNRVEPTMLRWRDFFDEALE